jgi:hypothetical protein
MVMAMVVMSNKKWEHFARFEPKMNEFRSLSLGSNAVCGLMTSLCWVPSMLVIPQHH